MRILYPALRQYRHNNSDEFITGYDKEETDKIVSELLQQIDQLYKTIDYYANSYSKLAIRFVNDKYDKGV